MGALGGILIADYWVIRKQRLSLPDLFREPGASRNGRAGAYEYSNGVNPRAVAALVIAVLPVLPGFLHAAATPGGAVANPDIFDQLYQYAWFVTFGLSFVVYWLLMRKSS
jgi:NCS1 family nucleobase:cation symporter-1